MKIKADHKRRTGRGGRCCVMCFLLAILCGVRIWMVNHSDTIENYKADTIVYEVGADIDLPDASYYWDVAELDGYGMRVTGVEVLPTEVFLSQYGVTMEGLEALSSEENPSFDDYGLIYLVTVEFWNNQWREPSDSNLLLDNYILTGPDYYVLPATGSIHRIAGFNPELNGASLFAIQSDRVFEVVLPYLIDTESETGISPEYLVNTEAKLLITVYPEEIYLKIPIPEVWCD